ncbi:hypothetical protein lerEdw1_011447 [Lerista edwardsae]|nr:hypothetical protein lerEdw1_011447 [Lerista edwardsae]
MGAGEGALLPLCLLALLVLPGARPATAPPAEQRMGAGEGALLPLCLLALLALPGAEPVTVKDTFVQLTLFQESFPSQKMSGEALVAFDEEEVFHVDWGRKETVWRLPNFNTFIGVEAQGGLGAMDVLKHNLEVLMRLSNRTQAQDVAPSATVYPKTPVEMGEPNMLICLVDQFFPPVLNITWLKNGEEVSEGVEETGFYPSKDGTFRKFSYLPFVPEAGDSYVCRVDHWGLAASLSRIWGKEVYSAP